jgi:hypothetical protein
MEAVYYAARANLGRLMMEHPDWRCDQLAASPQACQRVGSIHGKNVSKVLLSMMSRCCVGSPGPLIIHLPDSIKR